MNVTSTTKSILLTLTLALSNNCCFIIKGDKMEIAVTKITLTKYLHPGYIPDDTEIEEIIMGTEEICLLEEALIVTIQPQNATNKEIKWSTKNPEIITIENGKIIAHAAGKTLITATTNNGKVATYPIVCCPLIY
jgi:hypothetical protein